MDPEISEKKVGFFSLRVGGGVGVVSSWFLGAIAGYVLTPVSYSLVHSVFGSSTFAGDSDLITLVFFALGAIVPLALGFILYRFNRPLGRGFLVVGYPLGLFINVFLLSSTGIIK